MENGMGGNDGADKNPFRVGAQNTTSIEPAQAEDGAIVSTDATRNADYATDFEQRLNQQSQGQKRKRGLLVAAIVLGVLAVGAVGFLLVRTMNFGANSAKKQHIAELQSEVDSLINLVSTGEYKDEEVKEGTEDDELYIQKIIDASQNNKAKDKEKFFEDLNKSLKNIKQQLDDNGGEIGFEDLNYQKDAISEVRLISNIFEIYSGINYNDVNSFVSDFLHSGNSSIETQLLDDTFSIATEAKNKLEQTDDGKNFILHAEDDYREAINYISSEDELLTFLYYMNLDYVNKLSAILTLYKEGDCMRDGELDEVCRLSMNNTEAGVKTNKELIETIGFIKETMDDWSESIIRLMNNLRDELEELDK